MANLSIYPQSTPSVVANTNIIGFPFLISGVNTGCTIGNGTGVIEGSFVNLSINNTIVCTAAGTLTVNIVAPYTGATVTGATPSILMQGSNTLTAPMGNIIINLIGGSSQSINLLGSGTSSTSQIGSPELVAQQPSGFSVSPTPQVLQIWLCKPDLSRTIVGKLAEMNVITQKGQLLYKTIKYRKNGAKVEYVKTHTTR